MRPIDADKLKQHYAWLDNEEKELFDQIVNAQPTIYIDQLVYENAAELVNDLRGREFIEYISDKTWHKTSELNAKDLKCDVICIFSDGHTTFPGIISVADSVDGQYRLFDFIALFEKDSDKEKKYWKYLPMFPPRPEQEEDE